MTFCFRVTGVPVISRKEINPKWRWKLIKTIIPKLDLPSSNCVSCFSCLSKVDKCPLCRKKFSCLKCTGILLHNPLLIPDIEKLVDIPPTRNNALKPPSESEDSDDTLPAVAFNHATQPSSANTKLWLLQIIVKKVEKKILIKQFVYSVCWEQVAFIYEQMSSFRNLLCYGFF